MFYHFLSFRSPKVSAQISSTSLKTSKRQGRACEDGAQRLNHASSGIWNIFFEKNMKNIEKQARAGGKPDDIVTPMKQNSLRLPAKIH